MRGAVFAMIAVGLLVGGCKGDPSASPASTGPGAAPRPSTTPTSDLPPPPKKKPTTKLEGKELKETFVVATSGDEPFEKELETAQAKLGRPQKVLGDESFWWGWSDEEGGTCIELAMSPTKGSSVGATELSKCGMGE